MDVDLARVEFEHYLKNQGKGEQKKPPLSPLGYSQSIYLQMSTLEAIRALDYTLRKVNGNNASFPRSLERPVTAFQLLEREHDRDFVNSHLRKLGVKGI